MASGSKLTSADVARLLQDPNIENRADAAAKVADTFGSDGLSGAEREIAEDIFRTLVRDAAVRVRQALSETLADNPDVPHDVALTLAQDVDEVALPVIEKSAVLTDADLISIIQTQSETAQIAVAKRETVSGAVADAIADTENEDAVAELVSNEGADISEGTFGKVLQKFGTSERVQTPLAERQSLPLSVAERLVTMVSEKLRDHIMQNHNVSDSMAVDLFLSMREKATVSLLSTGAERSSVLELVDQLHRNKRLSPSIVVRALCMGDLTFFEAALAKMADIPVTNAYQLVHDQSGLGLERLMGQAGIPSEYLPIAQAALAVTREMQKTGGDDRELLRQLIIERVLTTVEDQGAVENLDYLLGKLRSITPAPDQPAA